jgi:hypothetical protein
MKCGLTPHIAALTFLLLISLELVVSSLSLHFNLFNIYGNNDLAKNTNKQVQLSSHMGPSSMPKTPNNKGTNIFICGVSSLAKGTNTLLLLCVTNTPVIARNIAGQSITKL